MNITYPLVNNILATLPIGYYLGTSASVKLDPVGRNTYCYPGKNEIIISFPTIKELALALPEESGEALENDIRCLLYHEISHLILTPDYSYDPDSVKTCTLHHNSSDARDIVNIFEDERIESILRNYYLDVDFKSFVVKMNGGSAMPPKTVSTWSEARSRFYCIVRFGTGTEEETKAVKKAIYETREVTHFNNMWNVYEAALSELWDTIITPYIIDPKTNEHVEQPSETSSAEQPSEDSINERLEKMLEGMSDEDLTEAIENSVKKEQIKSTISKMLKDTHYDECKASIDRILSAALAKKAMLAGAGCSYSGQVDPRLCGRDDFRWFARPNGDLRNKYTKIHLNLFIDISGSFWGSQARTNALIRALSEFENKNKDFSFDVVKINTNVKLAKKDDRYIACTGSNDLPPVIFDIYKQLQVPNARVYNLVVFDGQALCMGRANKINFRAFNHPNVSVISDTTNQEYFEKYAPLAKARFVRTNYCTEFLNNVFETLTRAFA